jgi:NAD(P)-dependent dehydrogenase (short-subunit alcohol dehydrogenase family)
MKRRYALITAGAQGLGQAITRHLAAQQYTLHLTQLALPLLEAATPPDRIINLGDSACDRFEAHVMATPYHIAKLGVHVLTRSYAQLLMPKGITVNMISPGFLEKQCRQPTPATTRRASGEFS